METQINTHDLQKKITGYLEALALETDEARRSEAMHKYLEFSSKFHSYSPANVMLIMLSKSDATNVAGFHTWKKMNRFVKKGEHGIPIYAPMIRKDDLDANDSPKVLTGFRIVYVFDISQTTGDPLPPAPDWKSPEKNEELKNKLIAFATNNRIEVVFKDLHGETQGVSMGGLINIDSSAGTKTLIHELAHEMMHQDGHCISDRSIKELEAESVAYVVSKYFGLEGLHSPNYIALHGVSSQDFVASLSKIQEVSREIINSLNIY